jgi:hypothetical protein
MIVLTETLLRDTITNVGLFELKIKLLGGGNEEVVPSNKSQSLHKNVPIYAASLLIFLSYW